MVGVGYLTYSIFSPYLSALFLATVFAIIFSPMHKKILRSTNKREILSALLSVIVVLFLILLPLTIISILMFQEASILYNDFTNGGAGMQYIDAKFNSLEEYVNRIAPALTFEVNAYEYFQQGLSWILQNINSLFSGVVKFTINLFIMILALFFLFKDGSKFRKAVVAWSPLSDMYDEGLLKKLTIAVNSVIKGALTIAIIQGILTGIGFTIFGIHSPVLWGFIASITALIPTLGTGIITVPAGIYLLFTGSIAAGVGLIIWGVFVVGLVDNFLRPILIKRGVKIHPFIILLSIFGGLSMFGPIGVLAGPIVVAFFFALLEIYPQIINKSSKVKL